MDLQGLGVGLTVLRQGLVLGTTALRRRMLVSLEINNKDRAYEWFLAWMAYRAVIKTTGSLGSTSWIRSHQLSVETLIEQRKNGSSSALFKLVAGPGTHWFKYRGAWMQVRVFPLLVPTNAYFIRSNVNERHVLCNSCQACPGRLLLLLRYPEIESCFLSCFPKLGILPCAGMKGSWSSIRRGALNGSHSVNRARSDLFTVSS